jgi:hypothetical protein
MNFRNRLQQIELYQVKSKQLPITSIGYLQFTVSLMTSLFAIYCKTKRGVKFHMKFRCS